MQSQLLKHIKPEKRDDARAEWKGCIPSLEWILQPVLEDKLNTSYSKIDKESNYDKPSVAMLHADQAGYRRALKEVLKLIGESRG